MIPLVIVLALMAMQSVQPPAFEVASIKPNPDSTTGAAEITVRPNGRFLATRVTLRALILRAYSLHESQLLGGPGWVGVERFDLDARAASPPPDGPDGVLPMLRTLLADRFRLRVHDEARELSAFLLTHARGDRGLGPQIRPTQADCSANRTLPTEDQIRAAARDGWPPCGLTFFLSFTTGGADGVVKVRVRRSAVAMKDFATSLQGALGRPVVDRTGLDGRWDIEYSYAPRPTADVPGFAENVPSLGAALDEQLGLKLDSERTPVPVLVIDGVERPSEN